MIHYTTNTEAAARQRHGSEESGRMHQPALFNNTVLQDVESNRSTLVLTGRCPRCLTVMPQTALRHTRPQRHRFDTPAKVCTNEIACDKREKAHFARLDDLSNWWVGLRGDAA